MIFCQKIICEPQPVYENIPYDKSLKYLALASAIWMSNPFSVFAIESAWSVDAAGNWNTTADWNNGVPWHNGASGDIADLTYDISANRTITLTNNLVFGHLEYR